MESRRLSRFEKLWTIGSIIVVRGFLGVSYACFLVCVVSVLSLGVYQHASASIAASE